MDPHATSDSNPLCTSSCSVIHCCSDQYLSREGILTMRSGENDVRCNQGAAAPISLDKTVSHERMPRENNSMQCNVLFQSSLILVLDHSLLTSESHPEQPKYLRRSCCQYHWSKVEEDFGRCAQQQFPAVHLHLHLLHLCALTELSGLSRHNRSAGH